MVVRLLALSLSLVFMATPAKAMERIKGATLTGKVALAGTLRSTERLSSGFLGGKTALAGTSRDSERLPGATLGWKNSLTGTLRASDRLSSGLLTSKTSLAGKFRTSERLTGNLGFSAGHQLITGTTRDSARLLSTAISLNYSATPSRDYPRLRGAFLGGKTSLAGTIRSNERDNGLLTSKLPLFGKVRASNRSYAVWTVHAPSAIEGSLRAPARLKGATLIGKVALTGKIRSSSRDLAQLQFQGTTTSITGTTRETSRLVVTGMSLAYAATPSRESERLRGATLGFVGVGGKVFIVGTSRDSDRLIGRLGLVYDVSPLVNSPRLLGAALIQKRLVTGTVRSTDRLRGASLSFPGAALSGTVRETERLRGALLTGKVSLSGTVRDEERLLGAILISKTALGGTIRSTERETGNITFAGATQLQGSSRVLVSLPGVLLTGKTALIGTIVELPRLSSGFLGGKTSLIGTVCGSELVKNASFNVRVPIAGTLRTSERDLGAVLILKTLTGINGKTSLHPRLLGATLIGTSTFNGTIVAVSILPGAALTSDLELAGIMRATGARLVNGLNPVGEPYRILDSTDHAVIFIATDRPFTMPFEKT